MRRWMIWALLAVLWVLQAAFAAYRGDLRQALLMVVIAVVFAIVGFAVRRRDARGS